jgi:hypothetical protein
VLPTILRAAVVTLSVFALVGVVVSPAAAEGGRPFMTELTGEAEVTAAGVPNQGDLDGTGSASLTINPGLGEVCWMIEVSGVEPIAAAHIHAAPATTTGAIVVPLNPFAGGCTSVSRDLALAIIRHPSDYYVNVHNAPFMAGALRGQLSR